MKLLLLATTLTLGGCGVGLQNSAKSSTVRSLTLSYEEGFELTLSIEGKNAVVCQVKQTGKKFELGSLDRKFINNNKVLSALVGDQRNYIYAEAVPLYREGESTPSYMVEEYGIWDANGETTKMSLSEIQILEVYFQSCLIQQVLQLQEEKPQPQEFSI